MSSIRLVCPRCGAQYDVPPDVIPPEGRDVQCSNCAHTWFEARGPSPDPDHATETTEQRQDTPEAGDDDAGGTPPEPPTVPLPERPLPPDVTEVFRQEREYEDRQRAQADPMESQPDLGLPDPPEDDNARRAREARGRMASPRPTRPEVGEPPAFVKTPQTSRRDLLPDVEEISETLRGGTRGSERDTVDEDDSAPPSGRSFRIGFALALVAGAVAMAVYASAPQIVTELPQARGVLEGYVTLVNEGRVWLHGQAADLQALIETL